MLASLPKGPSYYSPYSNYDRLVGYAYIHEGEGDKEENIIKLLTKEDVAANKVAIDTLKEFIAGIKAKPYSETKTLVCGLKKEYVKSYISVESDGCSLIDYPDLLNLLNGISIPLEGEKYIEYQTGRKDFILGRMLEDGYITFEEYNRAIRESIVFEFSKYREDIKHPYFVFYVKEYLEKKYGQDLLEKGGLKIYTSLDPKLQEEAERIVETQ